MLSATTAPTTWTAYLGPNVRRLMAGRGMTLTELSAATGLDQRTLRSILQQRSRPHARTLQKLAGGLDVAIDELFVPPGLRQAESHARAFDRASNSIVAELVAEQPALFAGWSAAEFDELYSQVGVGGAMTADGVRATAEAIDRRRELWTRAAVVLETHLGDLLRDMINLLFERVTTGSITTGPATTTSAIGRQATPGSDATPTPPGRSASP